MVDKLISSLAQKIENEFCGEYAVYTENVYQNVKKPCFFVECDSLERVQLLNGRFLVRVNVKVTIENDGDEKKAQTEALTATLFKLLGTVKAEGRYFNGRKIHGNWSEGSFVVRGIYDMWPEEEKDEELALMEKIEVKG